MRPRSLASRILAVSGLTLILFGGASFAVLYRAQAQLAIRAIDSLLKNDAFSLSLLVNAKPNGGFDFEVTPLALSNYQNADSGEFFRFIDPKNGHVYLESPGAPRAGCTLTTPGTWTGRYADSHLYRVRNYLFQPEIDPDSKASPLFERGWICLVVGAAESPYRALALQTLASTVPILLCLIFLALGILFVLQRILTRDLSDLAHALQVADFGGTHEFPALPEARTAEVKAVVDKLREVHREASEVYREIWLFLGRASHQLKTPVTAISATLQVLLRKERSREELIAGLSDIQAGADLLSQLTRKLTASSRIAFQSAGERTAIDLREFLSVQAKIYRSIGEERGVRIALGPFVDASVLGSVDLLSGIFGNLIENAVLYSNRGGTVQIGCEIRSGQAVISISDQGPGFPEVVKENLFKPFVRGDERAVSGSGLGLSSARKATQLLGGDIVLAVSTETGSRIEVTLPLTSTRDAPSIN